MARYTGETANALAAIRRNGVKIPMTIAKKGTLDFVKDTETGAGQTKATVDAVILPGPVDPNLSYEQASLIRQNSRKLLIAGATCPVKEIPPDTTFTFEGSVWTAKGGTRLAPDGGAAILHTVLVVR